MKREPEEIARQYFAEHSKESVMKAYYAYHAPINEGHYFIGDTCQWCKRTRNDIRHDDLPADCQKEPDVAGTIEQEEIKAFVLIARAAEEVPRLIAKGVTMSELHHTYGYDPETVAGIVDVTPQMLDEYRDGMEEHRKKSA